MKKIFFAIVLFLLLLALGGCGGGHEGQKAAKPPAATEQAYTAIDDTGRELSFAAKPRHIVSLTYGTDEILTELVDGKRIRAYSRWAGDSGISFVRKEQVYSVGRKIDADAEQVLALEPDLVVVSTATSKEFVQQLERLDVPVYIAQSPHNYKEMCSKINNLAAAVGEQEKGAAIVRRMDDKLQQLEQRLNKIPPSERRIAVAFNFTSAMGRKGDLLDSMLNMAHVINGAAVITENSELTKGSTPIISKEQIVRLDPDVFLLPTWNYNEKQDVQGYAYAVMNDPAYQQVKAVKNQQLKFVSDKYRYVASQHIVEAVENIARAVYPELF